MTVRHLHGLIFLLIIFSTTPLYSQQYIQSSLVFANKYQFNPAYAGFDRSLSITGGYRTQWLGVARNPVTQSVNAHAPLYLAHGAVGMALDNDILGASTILRTSLSYNYVQDSYLGLWSVGMRLGYQQVTLDGDLLRTPEGIYEGGNINHNDEVLPFARETGSTFFGSLGGYFIHEKFEGGIAIENILKAPIRLGDGQAIWNPAMVFNAFFEFFYDFSGVLSFHPSLFLKTDGKQTQLEVALRGIYEDNIHGGVSLRGFSTQTFDALILFGGLNISDNLKMTYAFGIPISDLNRGSRGSHEVIVNYNLNRVIGLGLPPKTIYNPRF